MPSTVRYRGKYRWTQRREISERKYGHQRWVNSRLINSNQIDYCFPRKPPNNCDCVFPFPWTAWFEQLATIWIKLTHLVLRQRWGGNHARRTSTPSSLHPQSFNRFLLLSSREHLFWIIAWNLINAKIIIGRVSRLTRIFYFRKHKVRVSVWTCSNRAHSFLLPSTGILAITADIEQRLSDDYYRLWNCFARPRSCGTLPWQRLPTVLIICSRH